MGGEQSKPAAEAKLPDLGAERFQKYNFPFENIVMEGGGAKGIAYIGAVKVLEDAGIMKNIKRFAGTSAGAITAGFLAAGMTAQDVLEVMNKTDMPKVLLDGRYWLVKHVGALYDLLNNFGVYRGSSFLDWYGDTLREHFEKKSAESEELKQKYKALTGDINFGQLYEALGVEFCTVAYNTQVKRENYFHVKTSPLLYMREAVRMSMSIPVVFQPYKVEDKETAAHWIDGGVCANFPVYCFDGWWLSMDEGNCFHERLGEKQDRDTVRRAFLPAYSHERFTPGGDDGEKKAKRMKTLGMLLYSEGDPELYQNQFDARVRNFTDQNQELKKDSIKPDTEKRRAYDENSRKMEALEKEKRENLMKSLAMKTKLDEVKKWFPDEDSMRDCFDDRMTKEDVQIITADVDSDLSDEEEYEKARKKAFDSLFINFKGDLTKGTTENIFDNWAPMTMAASDCLKSSFIRTPGELYTTYLDFVGKSKPIREDDVDRCVGIDVDYIGTGDFDMSPEDKTFLMMQGAIATVAFLEEFIKKNGLKPEK
ncbi:Hypp242 [Branchiostoma lanceolatum]|uniref:Hypp242 protein n=1 Tax=Branchiostoma lanceolatum TaxID=7740 RepID=A0A8J9V983_BRALA|nr:Hypp242 [Branchiostoma lanceolatum]